MEYTVSSLKGTLKKAIPAVIILVVVLSSFTVVGPGERGVVIRLGAVQDRIFDEGIHLKIPFVEDVVKMDVTIRKIEVPADSASRDLQVVSTDIALNYHIDPTRANEVYQTFRGNHEWDLINPAIQEAVKAGTAQFTAEELITERNLVKEEITKELKSRLEEYGISVDKFSIVNFSFSDSFNVAIEEKVTAEQQALAAQNKLEQVKFEAEQRVAQATAEAEAIRIQAEAIQAQGGENYVQLKSVEKWDGVLPYYMLGNTVPFINIGQ